MDRDREVYEMTHRIFDNLDAGGFEVDEATARFVRVIAADAIEAMETLDLWMGDAR